MTWVDEYKFAEPLIDIRNHLDQADPLRSELLRELSPGHVFHGRPLTVIARALHQDDIVVDAQEVVALVHLTWSQRPESPPWPMTEMLESFRHLDE